MIETTFVKAMNASNDISIDNVEVVDFKTPDEVKALAVCLQKFKHKEYAYLLILADETYLMAYDQSIKINEIGLSRISAYDQQDPETVITVVISFKIQTSRPINQSDLSD